MRQRDTDMEDLFIFRPLHLNMECRWMRHHLMHMKIKTNKLTTMCRALLEREGRGGEGGERGE